MTHRENQIKRTISPIPEDPCHAPSTAGEYVRAQDNCLPMNLEMEMYRRQPLRAVSPSILPGVRRISKERSESLRSQLVPGKYFAKSFTQFLGPFDHEPTRDELPSGDTFFILQHYVHISRTFQDMGQVDELGKRIFQHVKQIYVPAKRFPAPRPISPTELPGVRSLDNELDEDMKRSLVPGFYFAKSMTRYLGPFRDIPSPNVLPRGESYVILQEMGRQATRSIFRRVTQIDR